MPCHSGSTPSNERIELRPPEKRVLPIDARARLVTRTAFAILVVLLAFWVSRDLLSALTWAAVIAITTWPIYIRFASLISDGRSPVLVPMLFTLLTGLVLLVPIILTVHQIAQGSDVFVRWIGQLRRDGIPVPVWVAQLPIAGDYLDQWWQANLANPKGVVEWLHGVNLESVTAWTGALGGALLHRLFLFLITLVALFLMLRDGAWLANRALATADHLLGNPGVPHPPLFAVLTIAFAMVAFGGWIAFSAAALVLLLHDGNLWAVAGLFGFGAVVMLIGDNFIQPAFIGGTTRLPFLLILVGIIGGLQTFGLIGLFLGPVIMSALLTVWREWVGIEG
jgi:predicted PurR-regulated permease PerM